MSTLIGFPAVPAPVAPRRFPAAAAMLSTDGFPFAAAIISGDESVASYADEAARSCALGLDKMGAFDLRITVTAIRHRLAPARVHVPTLIGGASPFASEWGQDPAKCWPSLASRCD